MVLAQVGKDYFAVSEAAVGSAATRNAGGQQRAGAEISAVLDA